MDKPNETAENIEPDSPWGTWEELLLSCAVHRYGTNCWDSVSMEIQKRSSTTSTLHLTPTHCKQKYSDLKRRFSPQKDDVNEDDEADDAVPWLDKLRKLRVDELKREVERYDLSIVSLQLKVKRLKEEREENLREDDENGGGKSDLEKNLKGDREDGRIIEEIEPDLAANKPLPGEDNQSANESNSTDAKGEDLRIGTDERGKGQDPVQTGEGQPGSGGCSTKQVGENSCNGSSDSIEKEERSDREPVKDEPDGRLSDSPELWESVAESKGGGEDATAAMESSDVQSSANKSRKELEVDRVRSASVSCNEPEYVDQSPATKRVSVESHSLVDFLDIVRSHKLGSVFEQRLERQETPEYKNLIRQHVDLETIQTRLKEGWYSSFNSKFYRDLLLLVNNAIIFFGKESRESSAATELRQLVSKEIANTSLKFDSSAEEQQTPTPSSLLPLPSKPEPEPSLDSLLLKPKMISGPMIVCRKRSSISAKAFVGSSTSGGADGKREQKAEDKPLLDWKQPNKKSLVNNADENNRVTKKRTSDRFASAGTKSSKKNGKNRSNLDPIPNKNSEPLYSEHLEPKSEKNTTVAPISGNSKKRSAANFLSRMKGSSTTTNNNGSTLLDTLKISGISSNMNTRGSGEQKRSCGNGKGGDGKQEQAATSRKGSGVGRQVKDKEQGSPAKRNVGRPPKRAMVAPPSMPTIVSGKRSREGGGGDKESGASRLPKKKPRK